jgi:hypothetical protein
MKHSKPIEKIEKLLSNSGIHLMTIGGSIHQVTDSNDLPSGTYFFADLKVAVPISLNK